MDRKEFIHVCSGACLSMIGLGAVLQSCGSADIFPSTVNNQILSVAKTSFEKVNKDGNTNYRKHIIVQPEGMDYPLVIYRYDDGSYSSFLLKCTHQGNVLSVNGYIMTCAAHGSEFDTDGAPIQGPATQRLTSFPAKADEKMIYVQLNA